MTHLRPVLGPCPCADCGTEVTVYRVWYGDIRLPILVVHDLDGLHRCVE